MILYYSFAFLTDASAAPMKFQDSFSLSAGGARPLDFHGFGQYFVDVSSVSWYLMALWSLWNNCTWLTWHWYQSLHLFALKVASSLIFWLRCNLHTSKNSSKKINALYFTKGEIEKFVGKGVSSFTKLVHAYNEQVHVLGCTRKWAGSHPMKMGCKMWPYERTPVSF